MKKNLLLLWTALALVILPSTVIAQTNSTTVAEGTTYLRYFPVWGQYLSSYVHNQIIYPANMLTDLVGGSIDSIRFHRQENWTYSFPDTLRIQFGLSITEADSIPKPAAYLPDAVTPIYTGTILFTPKTLTIRFDSSFTYNGGNLLLDIRSLNRTPSYKDSYFCGATTDKFLCVRGKATGSINNISDVYRHKFLPKTTFYYTGGNPCQSPNGVTVTDITETNAVMRIAPRTGQSTWEYILVPSGTDTAGMAWLTTNDTTHTLSGLSENVNYTLYVRTGCNGEQSFAIQTSFHTPCAALTDMPHTWDFETDNTGGTTAYPLNYCWRRTPGHNYPYVLTPVAEGMTHSGNKVLFFSTAFATGVAAATAIDTNVLPINQLQVEFYSRMRLNHTSANVEVGVLDDSGDIESFQTYATVLVNSTEYNEEPFRVMFNEYEGSGNRIGFRIVDPSSNVVELYIDDVTLSEIPPCPKVQQLTTVQSTENSLTLSWIGTNNSYLVSYRSGTDTSWTVYTANADSFELVGLEPNTEYEIAVAPYCDTITDNMYAYTSAWTACAALTAPYLIDFETPSMYHCWNVVQQGVIEDPYMGDSYYPAVETSSNYARSGIKYVELGAQVGSTAIITAPKFEQNLESLRLMLYAREPQAISSTNILGTLQLGLLTTPYDTSAFIVLDTIAVSGTSYTPYGFDFDQCGYTGDNYYIAFRYIGAGVDTDNVSGIMLDDITVTLKALCEEPTSTTVSNTTTTTADFGWTGNTDSYKVYYRPIDANTYLSATVPAGDTVFTVTSLQPSTHYYYYVASVCEDNSEAPSLIGTFMTECGAVSSLPYTENFDTYGTGALPDCWQRINGVAESGLYYPMVFMNTSLNQFASTVPNCFAFNSFGTTRSTAILPDFSQNITNLRLSFDARPESNMSGTLNIGYMTNPADSSTFTTVAAIETNSLADNGYRHYLVDFHNSNAPEQAVIAFRYESDNDRMFFIDNVTVDIIPICAEPIQLTVSAINSTTARLSWYSNADSLVLHYKASTDASYSTETILIDSTSEYLLTGLYPSTVYTWYLTILCNGQEYTSATASFTTECAGITSVPSSWNFESGNTAGSSSNPLPACWHRTNNLHPYVYTGSPQYSHSGSRALLFNVAQGILHATLPPMDPDALSLDTLQLKFFARVYSSANTNTLDIGVMTDPLDHSTFELVQTVTITNGLYSIVPFRVNFTNYTGSGNYIAFRSTGSAGGNIYVDDVTLQRIPSCIPVENLTVTNTTDTSATISWTINEDITEFTVEYKPALAPTWEAQTVNGTTVTLGGLFSNTPYEVRVRPTCNPDLAYASANFTTQVSTVPPVYPTVVTNLASNIGQHSATLNGAITNAGNQYIITKGFEWRATTDGNYQTITIAAATALTHTLSELSPNTNYIYRAFAATSDTILYGNLVTFITEQEDIPQPDTCATPTGLHTTDIENHAITIAWNVDPDVSSWNIQYQPENGSWTSEVATTNSHTISGLEGRTTYAIRLQADCGNGNLSSWSPDVTATTTNVGLENRLANTVTVSPNPATAILNVQWTMEHGTATVELLDVHGRLLCTLSATGETTSVDVSGLASGIYFVRVTTEKGLVTKPFVIKQ